MCESTGFLHNTEKAAGNRRIPARTFDHQTVKVQAPDGRPLNPCHPARARELLRKKRAVRVCRHPYTLRLLPQTLPEALSVLSAEEPV